MNLFSAEAWLKAPLNRDVIARWTVGSPGATHAVSLPQPPDPERFEFLALGDSGDSESIGTRLSPQDAVAMELARDAAVEILAKDPDLASPANQSVRRQVESVKKAAVNWSRIS